MSIQIKSKWIIIAIAALILATFFLGHSCGRAKGDRANIDLITALRDTIKTAKVKIGGLEQTAYQISQIVVTQKEAIKAGLLEKEALTKLHLKTVNELTKVKATLKLTSDSVRHSGKVITIHDTIYLGKHALLLPFDVADKNQWVDFEGNFDDIGIFTYSLQIPISLDVYTGIDKKGKTSANVVVDNPYVVVNKITSLKMDLPKEKKWGIGIQAGYGLQISSPAKFSPFIGVGISRSIIRF